jgi:hypothetical protein
MFDVKLMPDVENINVGDYINIFVKKNDIRQTLEFEIYDFAI